MPKILILWNMVTSNHSISSISFNFGAPVLFQIVRLGSFRILFPCFANMEVSWNWVPPVIIQFTGIVPNKNQPFLGSPYFRKPPQVILSKCVLSSFPIAFPPIFLWIHETWTREKQHLAQGGWFWTPGPPEGPAEKTVRSSDPHAVWAIHLGMKDRWMVQSYGCYRCSMNMCEIPEMLAGCYGCWPDVMDPLS